MVTMSLKPDDLTPATAWQEYEPTESAPWNRARAAHLLRRAGVGGSWREITETAKLSPSQAVDRLIDPGEAAEKFNAEADAFGERLLSGGNVEALPPWWLHRILFTPDPLREKLTLFWHGHFATSAAKVSDARLMLRQNQIFRQHAMGKFGPLVQAISRDPAMLLYLDSATNRKVHPNENYAREVMELFCLGTGNYTERDIQELARAFTGWEVYRGRFRFNEYEHDRGTKTLLGQTGNFDGDEGVAVVVAQPAAARFIVRKLYRFFVAEEPPPTDELLEPLVKLLQENDFTIGPVVETMLRSRLFFSAQAMGRKVRSPIELAMGLLRALDGRTNLNELSQRLAQLGQRPFYPPNVKGWDGGRTWINSSTLLGRANLVRELVAAADVEKAASAGGAKSPEEIVGWAIDLLVAVDVPANVRASLVALAQSKSDRKQQIAAVLHAVGTLPEFQLV
jgi:uncharacterized protein (DUF1800 family)